MKTELPAPKAILESFTVPHLKDLLSLLTGKEAPGRLAKDELIWQIENSGPPGEALRMASKLEAIVPRRHSWLFSFYSKQLEPLTHIQQAQLRSALARLANSAAEHTKDPFALRAEDTAEDPIRNRLYLKLTHQVKQAKWVKVGPRNKELRDEAIRHTVVVVFRMDQGIAEIRFNGYAQGQATAPEDRSTYPSLVREAKRLVESCADFLLFPLHLQDTAAELSLQSADVIATRVVIKPELGGKILLDIEEGQSAEDIPGFVRGTLGNSANTAEIKQAIKELPKDSLMLLWKKHLLLTRLAFSDLGTEILYLWRNTDQPEEAIEDAVTQLLKAFKQQTLYEKETPTALILKSESKSAFKVSDLCQRFQSTPEEIIKELEELVASGKIQRCYRFRTSKSLHNYANEWSSDLSELPHTVEDEDGRMLSAFDPAAIEFGYRK